MALVVRGEMPPLASPDQATPLFLLQFTPPLLAGVVFAGVTAAIMSSVNSFLNIGAAAITHAIPRALGRPIAGELRAGRAATLLISVLAALLAQASGLLVAFLGIFGWGLFASTFVPALAVGLNWSGATRAGAIASIGTGLITTLLLETLAWFRVYSFPAGVSAAGVSLVLSFVVFFGVSFFTRGGSGPDIDSDVRLVMRL